MLIPLISFFVGIIILIFTFLTIKNNLNVSLLNNFFSHQNQGYFIVGNIFLATGLMLGLAGYFDYIPGNELRIIRLSLLILGILLLLTSIESVNKFVTHNPFFSWIKLKNILIILAASILTCLFLVSFFDANYSGDGFWYHLPFAGRIWGFIPPEMFQFEEILEYRYQGLPLLANFLQGFFWFLFQRPEAANLLCYFSLITFIFYLKFYLKIPFYLATISLLAVPMVHMHATKMYIDLPANIFAAIVILTVYKVALNNFNLKKSEILIIFISASLSTNMKFQMTPIIFIMIVVLLLSLIIKIWRNKNLIINNKIWASIQVTFIVFMASLLVFFTCVKNIVAYQNPFYPMKLEIAGVVLNHQEEAIDVMHADLRKLPSPVRWSKSLLEIGAFDQRRPWPWSLGMDFIGRHEKTFGVGGYFGGYVVFNLLVLAYLSWRFWEKKTQYVLMFFIPISLFTSYLPEAYKLRYYLYWMLILVGFNTYLCTYFYEKYKTKIINPLYFGLVATGFMLTFIVATRYYFTFPQFSGFKQQVQRTDIMKQELLAKIENGDDICLISPSPHGVLYSSYFYENKNYSVTAEYDSEKIERRCQGKKILRVEDFN